MCSVRDLEDRGSISIDFLKQLSKFSDRLKSLTIKNLSCSESETSKEIIRTIKGFNKLEKLELIIQKDYCFN